ncbi:MAG: AAA family ATPase [Chloroflexi bacterium]|nr:AAA family ATPase [Chloroflexota bacterium]
MESSEKIKPLPNHIGNWRWEREARIIGCIILEPKLLSQCRDIVTEDMFTLLPCALAWRAVLLLAECDELIDHTGIIRVLDSSGNLERIGGPGEILPLCAAVGTRIRFQDYVEELVRAHSRRLLQADLEAATEKVRSARTGDVSAVIEGARENLDRAATVASRQAELHSFADLATKQIQSILDSDGPSRLTPSGIAELDRVTGGLSPIYTVCAGYPGMGKTTFLVTLATNVARGGYRVLYISLEDPKEIILEKVIARISNTPIDQIQHSNVHADNYPAVLRAEAAIKKLPVVVENLPGADVARIRSLCYQYRERFGTPALVIVDHLGKIREPGKSLYESTSAASGKLADLQLDLGVPLVAASQLARRKDKSKIGMPKMDDLRDSGWLEADARQVWLLHRPQYYHDQGLLKEAVDPNECKLSNLKYPRPGIARLYADLEHAYIGDPPDYTPDRTGERY